MRLRDSLMCDVSDDFLVSDVFDDSPEVYAAMEGLTVQSSATIQPGFGSPNGGTGDRPRITVRPKRKRYTLTPSREDSIESSGIQVEARNGTVNAGYEGMNGSKSARLATGSASRRGTSLESDSPELTPFSPKTLATHDSVLAKRLFTASGARNGSILTTAPLISDIWDNVDVDASVALPPCAVVTATHAESDDMVAATVLLNGFGPPAPALRLQNTEDAVEKNSDSEEDDILQNDSMAVPRTNGRTANPTPKKATAKILLPTRRSARIARSYSGGSSRQYSGSIRFDSEPPTCCDVGRGTTRKRKVAELSDSDESKDETDVESDSSQIPAMLPGSQVKDKQSTPQHSADPVPVAVADVETSETETVDRTATPSVVPEVSDPIDAATQQQTEPVALGSDPESNEENHSSTEKDAAVHPNSDSGSNEEDHSSAEKDVVAQPDSDSRSNEEGHSSTENDVVAQQDIDPRSNDEDHLLTDNDVAPQPDSDEASLEASAPAEPTTPEKRSTRSTSLQTKQADSKPEDDSASEDSAASEASEASEDSATADSSSESVEPDSPAPAELTTPEKRSTRSTSLQTKQAESKPEEDSASEDSAASDSSSESVESDSPAATETELEPLASEASPKPTDAKVAGPYSGEPEVIPSMPESAVVSTEAPLEKLSNDESTSSEEDTSEDESTSEEDDSSEEESSDEESPDDEEAEDKAAADIGVSAEAKKTVVASSSAIKPIASKAGASSSPVIKPIASKTDASAPPVKAVAETASTSSTEASEEDTSEEESDEESSEEESSDDEEAVDETAADIGVSAEAKKTVVAPSPAIKPTASKAGASPSPAIKPIASKTDASAPPVKAVAETVSTSSTEASEETSTDEESSDEESSEEESSDEESSDDEEAEDEVAAYTGVSAEAEKTVVAPSPAIKPTASKTGVSASPVKAVAGTASTSTAEAKEEETADEESSDEESSEEESSSEGEASSSEEESSEESEDESESEAEKEANPTPVAKTSSIGASQPAKKANVEPVKAKSSSQPEKVTTTATVKDAAKDDSSSEDESESEEDSDSSVESDSSLESESEESDSESDKSDADSTAQQKPTKATNVKGAGSATDTPKPSGPVTPPPKVQPAAELRTPTQAGRRSTLASPPLSSSRRKIQLSKPMTPVEESESASEDDSDPPPRKLDKLPILGTPSMSRRTSGVLELAKNQRGGLRDGSGVKSISQIAGAKPYDELRKQMAKVAASRSSSSSQLSTVSFDIKAKDNSSDSESSESDSDSDSDSDSSSEEEMPAKGGAAGKQAKPPAMPGKRPQPIRFAGATKLTASAKARRRTSALLNL
ncbi:hypothetical protein GGH97_000469 [Coemansia sp. RSA 475]|nr:hypothetical protein GGH97_000469 [Coemansia sp. RSA 475]